MEIDVRRHLRRLTACVDYTPATGDLRLTE
jgi:hypothetical protein